MLGRGITLLRLFGIPIRIDASWVIIAGLVVWSLAQGFFPAYFGGLSPATYWWMGALGAAGLFISIVLHELGHSLVARRFGIPIRGITLFVFGGVAEIGASPPGPRAEFIMAIAGPFTSVVLAAICYGLREGTYAWYLPIEVTAIFAYLTWINMLLVAFNLVPAFPLDGGRVLRSILWGWKKDLRWATRIAATIGTGFAVILIVWGAFNLLIGNIIGGIWWVLIGLFIRRASQSSYEEVVVSKNLEGEPVHRFMTPNPITLPPSAPISQVIENYLCHYPYKMFPVVENDQLVGCVNVDDLKKIPREQWDQQTIGELAIPCSSLNSISPDADALKALFQMSRSRLSRLMVVQGNRLLGIIALRDLLGFISRKMEFERA